MPSNTTTADLIKLTKRLGCIHKAMSAEFELSYYRTHGHLPADAKHIVGVRTVNGQEDIALK